MEKLISITDNDSYVTIPVGHTALLRAIIQRCIKDVVSYLNPTCNPRRVLKFILHSSGARDCLPPSCCVIFVGMSQESQITSMEGIWVDALIDWPSWATGQKSAPAVNCPLPHGKRWVKEPPSSSSSSSSNRADTLEMDTNHPAEPFLNSWPTKH